MECDVQTSGTAGDRAVSCLFSCNNQAMTIVCAFSFFARGAVTKFRKRPYGVSIWGHEAAQVNRDPAGRASKMIRGCRC